jgi:hypothetical protein
MRKGKNIPFIKPEWGNIYLQMLYKKIKYSKIMVDILDP